MPVAPLSSSSYTSQTGADQPALATAKAAATGSSSTSSATSGVTNLSSTFLQLLTQELQNQDPTSPMDSTQMVGQMISLNQLEQLASINQTLTKNAGAATPSASGSASPQAAADTTPSATAANSAAAAHAALQAASMGNTLGSTSSLLQGAGASGL